MSELKFGNWIAASLEVSNPGQQILLGIDKLVFTERSDYQEVIIADVPGFGRGLFLDSVVQVLQLDEFIYHEHLAILPLLYHPAPRRVLILGGGDGLALREVVRDKRVERVTLVDIDGVVVRACHEHLSDLHQGSFDHPRAEIVIDDARQYLAAAHPPFDVVIVDLVDPDGPEGFALYTEVLRLVQGVLAPNAIVTTNTGPVDPPGYLGLRTYTLLQRFFGEVVLHRAFVPSFLKEWGFALASHSVVFAQFDPCTLQSRTQHLALPVRALMPEQYPLAFRLPPFLVEVQRRIEAAVLPDFTPAYRWVYPADH